MYNLRFSCAGRGQQQALKQTRKRSLSKQHIYNIGRFSFDSLYLLYLGFIRLNQHNCGAFCAEHYACVGENQEFIPHGLTYEKCAG